MISFKNDNAKVTVSRHPCKFLMLNDVNANNR